jgi:hypothetical protein
MNFRSRPNHFRHEQSNKENVKMALIDEETGSTRLFLHFNEIKFREWISLHLGSERIWSIPADKFDRNQVLLPTKLSDQIRKLNSSVLGNLSLRSDLGESIQVHLSNELKAKINGNEFTIVPVGKLGEATENFSSYSQEYKTNLILWYLNLSRIIEELLDTVTVPMYGTLLGTIRNQRLIGHDNDLDLGFVVIGDIVNQYIDMQKLAKTLPEYGFKCTKHSNGIMKVSQNRDSTSYSADIFPVLITRNGIRTWYEVHFNDSYDLIFPLKKNRLEGIEINVPNCSEYLLEKIYGEDWKIPNPSFTYNGRRIERSNRYFRCFTPEELAISKSRIWDRVNREMESSKSVSVETLHAHRDYAGVFFLGCPWDLIEIDEFVNVFLNSVFVSCLDLSSVAITQFSSKFESFENPQVIETKQSHIGAVNSLFDFLDPLVRMQDKECLLSVGNVVSYISKAEIRTICWTLASLLPWHVKILLRPETSREAPRDLPKKDSKRRDYFVMKLEEFGFTSSALEYGIVISRTQPHRIGS